jgi:Tol biopolymer transport system component
VNGFRDLDELERELGPSLRLALRRAAAEITDDPLGRNALVSYLQTSPDEQSTPRETPGGGRRRIVAVVAAIAAAAAILVAAIVLVSRDDESAPVDQPTGVTVGEAVPTSAVAPAGPVSPPYFLDLGTGERTPLADEIADPSVVSYVPSPDGTQLAFYTCCSADDQMTIANADGSDAQELTTAPGLNAYGPAWSRDGTKLVYQEKDGNTDELGALVVVDLATGEHTQVVDFGDARAGWWFTSPRFSADGEHVLYQYKDGAAITSDVYSVPVTGGEPTVLIENASYPLPVGDGSEIAFVTANAADLGGDSISIVRADGTGTPRTLVEAQSLILRPTVSPDGTRLAYPDGGAMWVVDVATGESTEVSEGGYTVDWVDDDTLVVSLAQ